MKLIIGAITGALITFTSPGYAKAEPSLEMGCMAYALAIEFPELLSEDAGAFFSDVGTTFLARVPEDYAGVLVWSYGQVCMDDPRMSIRDALPLAMKRYAEKMKELDQ